ncbi:MAG: AAA family ATPase [Chloroflexi bacterium]|nr:AAA family ATPase [Chloroflexota bacterium]
MLTRLRVRNFKRMAEADFELGKTVVLIGPNNSGKTTALQALALWNIGLKRWIEKRQGRSSPERRPGVTINRNDLISIPVPDVNLLWRDLHVRSISGRAEGKQRTQNIRVGITVDGITNDKIWSCGLEFDYANEESLYCRPLRLTDDDQPQRMPIPAEASGVQVSYLPPMSGLADREFIKQPGEIGWLIGQGQTAQVLRNLCYQIYARPGADADWRRLKEQIKDLFGVTLLSPKYIPERSEIVMAYKEMSGIELDLSSAGRGLQQTLLLLAHLYANPNTVLLLDEPDAHLEVLRQRQTYHLLTEVAGNMGSQIVAASHSEVVLNEAADRDIVIAFVGKPHRIDDRGSQVTKALRDIGFDQYYQAEQTGWALYLEGSTDLAMLREFARTLGHEASRLLEKPFVRYVANQPGKVREHFWGLREAWPDLVGIAIFDRLLRPLPPDLGADGYQWRRCELENYLCVEEVLLAYARHDLPGDLFGWHEAERREQAMRESIAEISQALRTLHRPDPWSPDIKATDEFLDPLFERYFEKLGLPNILRKTDYHILAGLVPKGKIDPEVIEKLYAIVSTAAKARPREN